jgi:hypothetical protein
MRRVTLRSGDGSGVSGIVLTDATTGRPAEIGLRRRFPGRRARAAQEVCMFVMEDITLAGQTTAGIVNPGAILALRRIVSRGTSPLLSVSGGSLTHLLESRANATAGGSAIAAAPAVRLEGENARLHVRDLTSNGFTSAIRSRDRDIVGPGVSEWVSDMPPASRRATHA